MAHIKDLLSRLGLLVRLEGAIVEKLEEFSRRIYALEENLKRYHATQTAQGKEIADLKAELRGKVRVNVET